MLIFTHTCYTHTYTHTQVNVYVKGKEILNRGNQDSMFLVE
jgi:hypothetical protein